LFRFFNFIPFKQTSKIELKIKPKHMHKRMDRLLIGMTCLPCFGGAVMSPATTWLWNPQFGAKDKFYCTDYYITLN
jgi:hypothetical protein